jgi:DNA-directed RNA polymerase subunit RPC12/RpoP
MRVKEIRRDNGTTIYKCDHCGNHFHQSYHFVVYTEYQFCPDCNRHLFDEDVKFKMEEKLLERL